MAGLLDEQLAELERLSLAELERLSPAKLRGRWRKIVETILRGEQPARLAVKAMVVPGFAASWREQERAFLGQ